MPKYRVLEQFNRDSYMHHVHDIWDTTEQDAAWNLERKRLELVVLLPGQVIIDEVADVPERTIRV